MKIDYREQDLIRAFPNTAINLPVGDIWICKEEKEEKEEEEKEKEKENGLVIERKTVKDLEASIMDGRYREQRGRILAYCHEHHTQPLYIIEGPMRTRKLPKETLMKFLNRLTLHYQIAVIRTESVYETIEWLKTLEEQWKKDPKELQRTTALVQVSDGIHVQKKVNANDPKQFTLACLVQCPGISVKMAEVIYNEIGVLSEVMKATEKQIQEIKVGARKIGPVVSKRLFDLLHIVDGLDGK
jgi:ERCC4-type nuclease